MKLHVTSCLPSPCSLQGFKVQLAAVSFQQSWLVIEARYFCKCDIKDTSLELESWPMWPPGEARNANSRFACSKGAFPSISGSVLTENCINNLHQVSFIFIIFAEQVGPAARKPEFAPT